MQIAGERSKCSACLFLVVLTCGLRTTALQDPVVGQQPSSASATAASTSDNTAGIAQVLLDRGDLLEISVYDLPDMAEKARVTGSGDISLPLLGSVHVAGLTADQAENKVEELLLARGYVKEPHVSILVVEYATQGVSVSGEVNKPGIYPVFGSRRLLDLMSAAGGLTDKAGSAVAITHRDRPRQATVVNFSRNPNKALENNVPISPGDTIVVSKAGVVFVVGDVGRPSGFAVDKNDNLTVLQAIALAEGTKSTASLDRAKLIRRNPEGLTEIPINLKKILAGKSPDLLLQPEDIVFVPGSLAKGAVKRSLEAIVQVATGVAIYRR